MIPFVFILLAASAHMDLVDEMVQVPAGDWRYVEVTLKQRPAVVSADYELKSGPAAVRLELMRREDLERLRDGLPNGVLTVTGTGRSGRLEFPVEVRGEYALVIDNRDSTTPAAAHVRVALDFGQAGARVTTLSPTRRLAVVVISFAVFFGIVFYSARRLLRGIRR
ncbi:MAG: hypothetical protein JO323_06965 [Acidobacteriia bacterium]|nr:hypothetical protein [Terriglobia bacterium]